MIFIMYFLVVFDNLVHDRWDDDGSLRSILKYASVVHHRCSIALVPALYGGAVSTPLFPLVEELPLQELVCCPAQAPWRVAQALKALWTTHCALHNSSGPYDCQVSTTCKWVVWPGGPARNTISYVS